MSTTREINIKPSCLSEIHGLPNHQLGPLWEKIDLLVGDPIPDGKLKKKLKGSDGVYRLRVGDFRVFYSFGDGWVRLLAVRRRDESTYSDKKGAVTHEVPTVLNHIDPSEDDIDIDVLDGSQDAKPKQFQLEKVAKGKALPRKLTAEWLSGLGVPPASLATLATCTTEEELLATPLPPGILERLIDNLFPRPIAEVQQQPDLLVQDAADLVRYREGSLLGFLLKLDDDQRALTDWALKGPTLIQGGAGTGKSTVALHRIKAMLEQPKTPPTAKVLFATYTNALIAASQQLLAQLLTPEQLSRVQVSTVDQVAREIVAAHRRIGNMESGGIATEVLRSLRTTFTPSGPSIFERKLRAKNLGSLTERYLLEEFDWIIAGRGLVSLEEYLETPRPGRGCAFKPGLRTAVWELYTAFGAEMRRRKIERWCDLRLEALDLVQRGTWKQRFEFVVVDEAQDLSPTSLALMADLARSETGLFFASDTKQSLYSRNYNWTSAHPRLQFRGRTRNLKRNYRSTVEIDQAAFELLEPEEGEVLEMSASPNNGPLPVLLTGVTPEGEAIWLDRFVRQMSVHLRMKPSAAAVLVPSKETGERLAIELSGAGLAARYFAGRDLDLHSEAVKIVTLHSAKGLEFPVVVIAGLEPGSYPTPTQFTDDGVYRERLRNMRRLLYVGMTRAMRGLMVIRPEGCELEPLLTLSATRWHVEAAS